MLVKMRTSMAGDGFVWQQGETVEISNEADANRIVAKGYATPIFSSPVNEPPAVRRGPGRPRIVGTVQENANVGLV